MGPVQYQPKWGWYNGNLKGGNMMSTKRGQYNMNIKKGQCNIHLK